MEIITYQELLNSLDKTNNHLLLGNGFNTSLGIYTDYKNIYDKMIELYPDYKLLKDNFETNNYDLEQIIDYLQSCINNDKNNFLTNFIIKKIKKDFLKATFSIVSEELKKIYQEKNEGIYVLLSKFTNYFTLNFDPFLYLLLMKYKKNDINKAVVFQGSTQLFQDIQPDMDSEIQEYISTVYKNGLKRLTIKKEYIEEPLKGITKADRDNQIRKLLIKKFPSLKKKDINKRLKSFYNSLDTQNKELNVNDGFIKELFINNTKDDFQNVFFLHGAFFIYSDRRIKKITKTTEKAMYQKVEEVVDSDDKELIFILQARKKEEVIKENEYLIKSLNKLSVIKGDIVLFGSSLSDKDNHIFSRINDNTQISKVYISTSKEQSPKMQKIALGKFNKKEIVFFDYKTVSYNNE